MSACYIGSPASAGIDPPGQTRACGRSRLPRIRGDRPAEGVGVYDVFVGSPASAGIDPHREIDQVGRERLPRIRGDRPKHGELDGAAEEAPPHPRGSTHRGPFMVLSGAGSPASAGIDPTPTSLPSGCSRLPRIRGDRPVQAWSCAPHSLAPPHPRGSTLKGAVGRLRVAGSPASAGIDPSRGRSRYPLAWLPRIRGDRPAQVRMCAALG